MPGFTPAFTVFSIAIAANWAAHAFVVNVQAQLDETAIEKLELLGKTDQIRVGGGWSAIFAPNGEYLAGPHRDDEKVFTLRLTFRKSFLRKTL